MNPAPDEKLFRLQRLENGIYEFIFLEGTIATVNAPQLILLNSFINWIQNRSRERVHFLPITRRDEGIAWLLRDD